MCDPISSLISYLLELQLMRFLIVGTLVTGIYYAIFLPLEERLQVRYYFAATIAFVPSFSVNFVLQKYWAFRNESAEDAAYQLVLFSVKNVILFGANIALLWAFKNKLGLRTRYAQFLATAILTVISFFASRWIFKS